MVAVLGITVAGYYKAQPLPLQTLPFAEPEKHNISTFAVASFYIAFERAFRGIRKHVLSFFCPARNQQTRQAGEQPSGRAISNFHSTNSNTTKNSNSGNNDSSIK